MAAIDLDAAAAFIAALSDADGWEEPMLFQTFDDSAAKRTRLGRVLVGPLRGVAPALQQLNGQGACVAVTINVLRGSRRLASEVRALRALFIDADGPLARALAVPPSISVESRNGPHHYWRLAAAEPVSLFAAAQRQLAAFYGADPMVSDPSRVMRLPGFLHQKKEPFAVQLVQAEPSRVYSMREVLQPLEGVELQPARPAAGSACTRPASPEAVKAFRRWAASAPRLVGTRNATAFVMAAEGLKTGIPAGVVESEVRAFCDQAGISEEAGAVLRSARRRAGR
jgi:hypothetical protein